MWGQQRTKAAQWTLLPNKIRCCVDDIPARSNRSFTSGSISHHVLTRRWSQQLTSQRKYFLYHSRKFETFHLLPNSNDFALLCARDRRQAAKTRSLPAGRHPDVDIVSYFYTLSVNRCLFLIIVSETAEDYLHARWVRDRNRSPAACPPPLSDTEGQFTVSSQRNVHVFRMWVGNQSTWRKPTQSRGER